MCSNIGEGVLPRLFVSWEGFSFISWLFHSKYDQCSFNLLSCSFPLIMCRDLFISLYLYLSLRVLSFHSTPCANSRHSAHRTCYFIPLGSLESDSLRDPFRCFQQLVSSFWTPRTGPWTEPGRPGSQNPDPVRTPVRRVQYDIPSYWTPRTDLRTGPGCSGSWNPDPIRTPVRRVQYDSLSYWIPRTDPDDDMPPG